ncbi:MAG: hypothetical protein AAFQ63_12390 [Cyanobacteria bacterium J06621_11]
MTTYRTDKTSRVVLAIFVAYMVGYAIARSQTLRLLSEQEVGDKPQYIVKTDTMTAGGWEYNVFWPAVKLEEQVRNLDRHF